MRLLIEAGVDGIMSDYPDRLVAAQKKDNGKMIANYGARPSVVSRRRSP